MSKTAEQAPSTAPGKITLHERLYRTLSAGIKKGQENDATVGELKSDMLAAVDKLPAYSDDARTFKTKVLYMLGHRAQAIGMSDKEIELMDRFNANVFDETGS